MHCVLVNLETFGVLAQWDDPIYIYAFIVFFENTFKFLRLSKESPTNARLNLAQ